LIFFAPLGVGVNEENQFATSKEVTSAPLLPTSVFRLLPNLLIFVPQNIHIP